MLFCKWSNLTKANKFCSIGISNIQLRNNCQKNGQSRHDYGSGGGVHSSSNKYHTQEVKIRVCKSKIQPVLPNTSDTKPDTETTERIWQIIEVNLLGRL